ncbi:MAG TPA: hypothetical protein PLE94_06850, partial [Thermotogota bacterium]|nr:hypothetical protein [Thermotogota bacterium]
NRLQNSSFPPCLLSKLRGPDFFPGRLAFFLLNISALPGRTKVRRSQYFLKITKSVSRDFVGFRSQPADYPAMKLGGIAA